MTRKEKARRRRKKICLITAAAALTVAVVLAVVWATPLLKESNEVRMQEKLSDMFQGADARPFFLSGTALAEEETQTQEEHAISARLAQLYNINSDLVGWLQAGDAIDTPVVFRDNEYYLTHDFYGNAADCGTVFADKENENWSEDQYLVVYGHNMRTKIMFGHLDEYMDLDYFKAHPEVTFYHLYDDEVTQYVPFAVIDASMTRDNDDYFFLRRFSIFEEPVDQEEIKEFIKEIQARSMYEIPGLDVSEEDKLLVLVTCSYELEDGRAMVFYRALREDETLEDLTTIIQENTIAK